MTVLDYPQTNPCFIIFLNYAIQLDLAVYQVSKAHDNLERLGHSGYIAWDVILAGFSKEKKTKPIECVLIL